MPMQLFQTQTSMGVRVWTSPDCLILNFNLQYFQAV